MSIALELHPIEVKRDVDGNWRHPALPELHVHEVFDAWATSQGFRLFTTKERVPGDTFLEWTPERPPCEGWFDLEVTKKGNLASWTWAKKVTP